MDELEPWHLFTNDFLPDVSNNANREQNPLNSYNDSAPNIRNMQVKEEPVEPLEIINDDQSSSYGYMNHSSFSNTQCQQYERCDDDNTIFDFGLDSSSGGKDSTVKTSSTDFKPLSAEDQYYHSLIKFEDAIVYICPACGQEFKAQELWKRHLNVIHRYNTRNGLNFMQLDKLYHQCMECNKRIAMHSMENLLKHKFTHLPYRCSKCSICQRQYKYRQDLMVHIRMMHRDDLLAAIKAEHQNKPKTSLAVKPEGSSNNNSKPCLTIGDVKENAFEIFDNTADNNIEVKNEFIDPNEIDDDQVSVNKKPAAKSSTSALAALLDEGSSNGSTAEERPLNKAQVNIDDDSLEEYILFLCPQCGTECETQAQWRQHIEFVHDFGSYKALNFKEQNSQAQCLECNQIIPSIALRSLQAHKFTHLPHKEWLTCKLCFASFSMQKDITKHLDDKHHLHGENAKCTSVTTNAVSMQNEEDSQDFEDYDSGMGAADVKEIQRSKSDERDAFEQHIDYLCPQCGKEYNDKKLWRKHIADVHQLADLEKLNFEVLNDRQLRCRECDKIITNAYGIQNAQQHRITHMRFKSFARCRLCRKAYTDRKGLIKHLRSSHRVGMRGVPIRMLSPSPMAVANSSVMRWGSKLKSYHKSYGQKEVVRSGECTYEIHYLDEDDEELANADEEFGENADKQFSPNNHQLEQMTRHRCVDCGSQFSTQNALQNHIKNEHDFMEYDNSPGDDKPQPVASTTGNDDDQSNDTDADLLVPTGDVDIQPEENTSIEINFIYLCPQCGEEFRTQALWRRHINVEHNFDKREYLGFRPVDRFRYQCKVCKDTVQSSKLKGLQDHKFRHCPYKLYLKCLLCSTSYNHKPNMLTHLRQRHNIIEAYEFGANSQSGNSSNVGYEELSSSSSSKIGRKVNENSSANNNGSRPPGLRTVEDVISFHNAVDHDTITYYCPSCYENFESHVYWRKHIVEVHNLNSREGLNFRQLDEHHYICLQCYKRVTVTHTKGAIGQLQSHKFRHLPYKSFRCTACQGEFVRKQMFFKHLDKNTNKCNGINPNENASDEFSSSKAQDNSQHHSDQFDDDLDLSGALVQRNGADFGNSNMSWPSRDTGAGSSSSANSYSDTVSCFTINCPQCGIKFDTTQTWREHINIEHQLNNRTVLNFKRISPKLHQCLECKEHVNGRKLRDLQVHKFKHLPHGAYIHCRYCSMAYFHISNMQEHLKNKHPHMLNKLSSTDTRRYEDENIMIEGEDEEDGDENPEMDEEEGEILYGEEIDPADLLEAEAEIEEVDPDAAESEEQYLLG
uniref:C2H2-type domain-containing protein n=1 Tax=Glossina austeni TaxID=7395 RepID=A0A1A9VCU0_GLOAU